MHQSNSQKINCQKLPNVIDKSYGTKKFTNRQTIKCWSIFQMWTDLLNSLKECLSFSHKNLIFDMSYGANRSSTLHFFSIFEIITYLSASLNYLLLFCTRNIITYLVVYFIISSETIFSYLIMNFSDENSPCIVIIIVIKQHILQMIISKKKLTILNVPRINFWTLYKNTYLLTENIVNSYGAKNIVKRQASKY